MKLNKLTDREAKTAAAGLHSDGGGLYLNVKTTGARAWVFVYRTGKRRREMGLGGYPGVKLVEARAAAVEARAQIARGEDPIEARRANAPPAVDPTAIDAPAAATFKVVAQQVIDSLSPGWRGAKTKEGWERSLLRQAAPLADKLPADITTQDVLDVLNPYWTSRPESAGKLRDRIETVLDVAKVNGLREGENPARWRGHLALMLPKRRKLSKGHHRALPYERAAGFMAALLAERAMGARALSFVILTGVREGVVRTATWGEISPAGDLWTIPKARMKSERDHRVPLSAAARAVLVGVNPTGSSDGVPPAGQLIFPGGKPGRPLSNTAVAKPLKELGVAADATIHGFRSTLRDWAGDETDHPREVIEAALAHLVGDETEQAYRRRDALEKRRRLMDDWGTFLTTPDQAASRDEIRSM
ncbi:integrase arm-type DNA-binding domain-containing protein [uncultured Brevundimonas sp.]|uniref:tyrosine-type recombinase/integrase n=1 Tax=uncultured Brevundimonas sp. TaxID=213418 RepID=UPI0025DFE8BB|nr:integrase arm-type DNA-binding domain-containing protein [uncultured Brevundimonas sp.]